MFDCGIHGQATGKTIQPRPKSKGDVEDQSGNKEKHITVQQDEVFHTCPPELCSPFVIDHR